MPFMQKTERKKRIKIKKKSKKTELSKILAVSFFAVSLIGSIILVSYSSSAHNKIFEHQIYDNLKEIARISANHSETFLKGKKERVIDFASDGFIKNSLKKLQEDNSEKIIQELSEHLIDNKIVVDESFFEVFVLDALGKVVGTTYTQEKFGEDFSRDLIFTEGKKLPYIKESFYDKEFGRNSIAISAPILHKGEFVGVIVIKMSLNDLIKIITDAGEFNKYGEIYVIDNDSFMLTPSKFLKGENKGVLIQEVDTKNSENCIKDIEIYGPNAEGLGKRGKEPISFLDYRGEKVIGTYKRILGTKWCLLAEIDEEKTLEVPMKRFVLNQIFVSAILILIIALMGLFIGKFLDKRYRL